MEITINWRFIVGIDVSKKQLDISLYDRKNQRGYEQDVPNATEGFEQLVEWLENHGVAQSEAILISEHTGRYGEQLLRWTTDTGWPHAIVKTTALQKVGYEHERKTDGVEMTLDGRV